MLTSSLERKTDSVLFSEEYIVKNKIIVSNDPFVRKADDIMIYRRKIFLEKLWSGEII